VVAPLERPVGVRRDVGDGVRTRPRHHLGYDRARVIGEAPEPALLPRRDERLRAGVVRDRGASGGEREPPRRALAAPRNGPCRRRPAPRAAGTAQPPETGEARLADRAGRSTAGDTAKGKQKIEQKAHTQATLAA
jgi:hypothetical protein